MGKRIDVKDIQKMIESAQENNEPVFLLRAKDVAAVVAIRAYLDELELLDADDDHIADIMRIKDEFWDFRNNNRKLLKIPD